ncbi:FkbM family methyltransferase [Geminocystis sp.]|uniref:FkbM family methyltransferase n=1 Tax=Geminocystis sp. TaxID=2664100 RepID=UPI003593B896
MFISYAQNFEDVLLNRIFKNQEKGFYIDIGAHHPIYDSVTKAFYEKGWTGINIEPVPKIFHLLEKDRPNDLNLNIAISDRQGESNFYELLDTGLSTFDREMTEKLVKKNGFSVLEYPVIVKTLGDVCRQYINQPIDFLKIDVEGWEEKVILGHDWQNFRPKIVLLEATIPNSSIRKETNISDFLNNYNYQHIYFDGLNDFYLAEEFSPWKNFFTTPVNVFDKFICFSEYDQKHHISNLEKNIDINKNQTKDLNFQIKHLEKILLEQQKLIDQNNSEILNTYDIIAKHKEKIINLENTLKNLGIELDQEKEMIKAMESSKFWKLRKKWFKVKEKIGLPIN